MKLGVLFLRMVLRTVSVAWLLNRSGIPHRGCMRIRSAQMD